MCHSHLRTLVWVYNGGPCAEDMRPKKETMWSAQRRLSDCAVVEELGLVSNCQTHCGYPVPKGPFRTKNTTTIVKIVNYYAVVFLLRPQI